MGFATIGTDTELFARNKEGKMVALCGKIGGTKEKPKQIPSLPRGYCIQEDNVALEFNIPPTGDIETFIESIRTMRQWLDSFMKGFGLTIPEISGASFPKTELTHPNALIFGCEPDYSAWSMSENPKPACEDETFRTAGGHIHVGTNENMIDCVRRMDLYLGVPSVLIDNTEGSVTRRTLYGKAGAMRPKPYGFEYRVLSNFWVFDDKLVEWVYKQTARAVSNSHIPFPEGNEALIVDCINNGDKKMARDIVREYGLWIP